MKYRVINTATNEEHICDKVTIDGFDYYFNEWEISKNDKVIINHRTIGTFDRISPSGCDALFIENGIAFHSYKSNAKEWLDTNCRKIICTNNPTIDIPKVVDEVEELFNSWYDKSGKITPSKIEKRSFLEGYNKSQETHPFSEEDVIGFAEWAVRRDWKDVSSVFEKSTKDLLQLWKEQKPKTVYYNI